MDSYSSIKSTTPMDSSNSSVQSATTMASSITSTIKGFLPEPSKVPNPHQTRLLAILLDRTNSSDQIIDGEIDPTSRIASELSLFKDEDEVVKTSVILPSLAKPDDESTVVCNESIAEDTTSKDLVVKDPTAVDDEDWISISDDDVPELEREYGVVDQALGMFAVGILMLITRRREDGLYIQGTDKIERVMHRNVYQK
ncbi:Fc.00g070570.m01.CDS01 [Cosmosporella sp. VM-42]